MFIAMDNDDVLSRTASFQIQPPLSMRGSSRSRNRSRDQWSDIARAFSVLYDSEVPISELLGGHDEDENLYSSRAERLAQAYRRRRAAMASQFPPEFSHGRATFRVTTECSDSDTDEDSDRDDQGGPTTGGGHRGDIPAWAFSGMRSSRTIPNRIGSLPFETDGNEDEDFDDDEEEPLDHNDATDSEGSDRDESIFAGLVGMRDALGAGTGPGRFTFGESRTLRAGELDFLPENTFNAIMRSLQPSQHLARESSGAGRRLSPDRIMAPSQSELAGGSSTGQSASRGPAVGGSGMRSTTGAGSAASRDNSNDRSGSRRGSRVPPPPPPLPQQQQQQQRPQTLAEVAEAAQLATQEAVRAVGGQVLFPLCHFHIERGNSRCRLRFDPPASGRFLLLKMWSPNPHHDGKGNIDIQAVVAKGFAGPRYFPAVQLR